MSDRPRLIRYIWELPNANRLCGRFQYGDGVSMGGGAATEEEAWKQLYFDMNIQRQLGADPAEVLIVFGEPAPVSEEE